MDKLLNNKKIIGVIFYISIFVFIYAMSIVYNSVDMDYWARLLQGRAFLQSGHILKIDTFSYTQTHIWLDHEWGASIIFAFVQNFGYKIVLFFKSLLVFFTFFFIFKTIKLNSKKTNTLFDVIYFVLSAFAMPTITQSWLRCHFFTFLFFAVSVYILEKARHAQNFKLLIILPVLMIFWENMHGGCVSLLGILAIYSLGEILAHKSFKYYLITLICCFAVMFINPYGIDYVKFVFTASLMERPFVTEWISPFFHQNWNFLLEFKILYLINFAVLLFSLKSFKKDYTKYIFLIVCAYLSFKYVKNTPFFIITAMIFLYEDIITMSEFIFNRLKLNFNTNYLTVIMCIILCFSAGYMIKRHLLNLYFPDLSLQPVQIVNFIKTNNLKGNILAPFDMGSYIIYKLYPNNLVYMDGRYEEVYTKKTKELLDNFYLAGENWDEILNTELKHDYIIVPDDALLNDFLLQRNDYKLIYKDNNNCLYESAEE